MMRAPLVPITLGFLFGIAVHPLQQAPPVLLLGLGLLAAVLALRPTSERRLRLAAVVLCWGCLGWLRAEAWSLHPDAGLYAVLSEEPQPITLHAVVVNDPAGLFDPEEPSRQVCVLRLLQTRGAEGWRPAFGRVRATLHTDDPVLVYGDEVVVEGEWMRVPSPGNPGQYDWRAALARQRIHGLLRVKPFDGLAVLTHGQGSWVMAAVTRLRRRWERLIRTHFSPRDAGLLLGLLLGQRVALEERLKDAFVETGTIHLLVISGFNVGLIAVLLELIFRVLGLPWRLRLAGSAVLLGGYCLLTGLQPPVVRATLMAWVVLGAYAMDRVISWPNTLAAASLLILWVNPTQLFDPSFQLSFGAVASLLLFTSSWSAWLDLRLGWMPAWLRRYVTLSLSATGAVWAGLAPVLAWYFHLVAPVSVLANLLLAPLMSALVSVGTAALMIGTCIGAAVGWSAGLLHLLLEATRRCVAWCHAIPGGYWFVPHPSVWWLAGYYLLVALTLLRRRLRWSHGHMAIGWAIGLLLWAGSSVILHAQRSRQLTVDVMDVGHGDSILVRTPGGQAILVDAGSQEAGRYQVIPFLRYAGITSLDALVLTHTDEDHLGGAIPLLQQITVKQLLTNGVRGDTMSARQVRALASARGIPETVLAAGMTLEGDPRAVIQALHPPAGLVPGVAPKSNDNSVVLRVAKGNVSILLTGDIEEEGLPWLLRANAALLHASVLKVPHHGSRLGRAGAEFFRAVSPRVAMLSVGRAHHLPARETLEALRHIGAHLYSTRDDGAIHMQTDGEHLYVRGFRDTVK